MLNRILALILKEFIAIWKDPKSRSLIIAPPLLQLIIFAHAITMEVKNIDMAVLDRSNTVYSREIISRFQHSRWFRTIYKVENEQQIKNKIETQKVQVAMEINSDFAKNIISKKPTEIQIIVDGRQTNSAAIASGYANQIINQYASDIKNTGYGGQNITQGGSDSYNGGAKINIVTRSWFNPNLEFLWYTLVSLISLLALIITLLLTALSIAREKELGTFEQLIVSPLSSFEILAGKTIPPLILSVCLTLFMTSVAIIFFKLPFVGNIFVFLIATVISLFSIVGVGLFISSICKTQQQAILGVFTFQTPAVLLSGFISPIEDMPVILQYLTYLNPIRFYMLISKGVFLKEMSTIDVFYNLIPLIFIAFITLSLASWMFKQKLD